MIFDMNFQKGDYVKYIDAGGRIYYGLIKGVDDLVHTQFDPRLGFCSPTLELARELYKKITLEEMLNE